MFQPRIASCAFAAATALVLVPATSKAADYWVKGHSWLTGQEENPVNVDQNSEVTITLGTSSYDPSIKTIHFEISYDPTVGDFEQAVSGYHWIKASFDNKRVIGPDATTGLNVISFDQIVEDPGQGLIFGDLADVTFRTRDRSASMAISRLSVTARDAFGNALPVTLGSDLHVEVVPEPAAVAIFGLGAVSLVVRRRR